MPSCKNCNQPFTVYPEDIEFYHRIDVSEPTLCPECREQQRLAFRNERFFYLRKCDHCRKETVSVYSLDKDNVVYCQACWWSDDWDLLASGREFDLARPFFEQLAELEKATPAIAIINKQSVNSEYTNICAQNKNCYLLVESSGNEDCYYSYWIQRCRDCLETSFSHETELGYECDNCFQSYNLFFSRNCENCKESYFLLNCQGCSDCFGCVNLVHKQFCVFNKQLSENEYRKFLTERKLSSFVDLEKSKKEFAEFLLKFPRRYGEIVKSQDCSGNYINRSKKCFHCHHAHEAEDCRYSVHVWRQAKDCFDVDTSGMHAELIYNSINTAIKSNNCLGCRRCWTVQNLQYCVNCDNCKNCFGCVSLRNKQFCILNKQYSEEEYSVLAGKIISQLKKTGEWGQFSPAGFSPFGYNETVAQEYYPLTREEVLKRGWSWQDKLPGTFGKETIKPENIPDDIKDVKKDIIKQVLTCADCAKNYKIIGQELDFYQKQNLPLPRLCPDCRHARRMELRNPRKLWLRKCDKCGCSVETTYAPERPEVIYCEECYQKEIY